MKTLPIITYPKRILKKKAEKVLIRQLTDSLDIDELIAQMKETMREADGIGLAAPQINISKRIILVDHIQDKTEKHKKNGILTFLNPDIVQKSKKQETDEEGCLSLPGLYIPIKRSAKIELTAQTPDGEKVRLKAHGLAARILQHEVDHLNGKLIIDRINPLKRLRLRHELKEIAKHSKSV